MFPKFLLISAHPALPDAAYRLVLSFFISFTKNIMLWLATIGHDQVASAIVVYLLQEGANLLVYFFLLFFQLLI